MPLLLKGTPEEAAAELLKHATAKYMHDLQIENAELTDKVEKLEVALGQLLKEVRFFKKLYAGMSAAK